MHLPSLPPLVISFIWLALVQRLMLVSLFLIICYTMLTHLTFTFPYAFLVFFVRIYCLNIPPFFLRWMWLVWLSRLWHSVFAYFKGAHVPNLPSDFCAALSGSHDFQVNVSLSSPSLVSSALLESRTITRIMHDLSDCRIVVDSLLQNIQWLASILLLRYLLFNFIW